ncbi:MAG: LCP family protein [Acidimicrobiia bacterium]|nr:LCP family protein [Acidimicrobiia bacterium]
MQRTSALILALSLVLAVCGRDDSSGDARTTSAVTPAPSTSSSTTSTAAASTTTEPALADVRTDIEGADEVMATTIAQVYAQALNPGQDAVIELPTGLIRQYRDNTTQPGPVTISGSVHTGRILDTDIAVFTNVDDVVLLAGEPGAQAGAADAWQVVGAKLAGLGEAAWYGDGPRLVLVLGSDARPGQRVTGFRADSVHIVGSVPATGQGSIVGIPRDSWVDASYGGRSKLTNTMASRGPEVVLETVQALTGLELEGYLVTGFAGFEDLIDGFGGFTIDVPYGMSDSKSNAYFRTGVQEFDGADALAFSRNRTDTPRGDFGRSFNHGVVMLAVMPEVQSMGIDELPRLLELLTAFVLTDLSASDLLAISAAAYELDPEQVTNIVAPGRVGSTSGGASVVFLQEAAFELFADISDGVVDGDY